MLNLFQRPSRAIPAAAVAVRSRGLQGSLPAPHLNHGQGNVENVDRAG